MSTTKKTIQLFWQHAWRYPHLLVPLLVLTPAALVVHQFLPPLIAANILDRLSAGDFTKGDLWGSFGHDILTYLFVVGLGAIVLWRIVVILIWIHESYVARDLARTQFNHLMKLSANFHANSFGGSLVSQTNKLIGAYHRLSETSIFQVYTMVTAYVVTVTILWPRSPQYVMIILVFSVLFIWAASKISRRIRELNTIEAKAQNKMTGVLADAITNILAVKSFSSSKAESERFDDASENVRLKTLDTMRAATLRDTFFSAVTTTVSAVALIFAIASVVIFDAEIGTVFLLLTYTANIAQRLWDFSQSTLRNYNRAIGDAQDGTLMLQIEPEVQDPSNPEMPIIHDGAIQFKNVTFKHDNNKGALFKNLNITIKAGEKVGLVGHSGSGKTTFTNVLLRYADLESGAIEIDGQNIANIKQDDLRRNIAFVPQEPLLFHRSIAENISYGKANPSEKEILQAAKQANAHNFIKELPDGYKTLVGERGVKLSGGQRQRIAIARALLKDVPILVLDEATSALDSESEKLIQDALWNLMEGRTAIVIAHRLSTIQKMDRILVMEDGRVIEDGSHKQLLKEKGIYSDLWAHQSGGFIED